MDKLNKIWDAIIELGIASEEELQLITNINGYNEESLNDVIYTKVGYRDIIQYQECEGIVNHLGQVEYQIESSN
tara:strand:+ start:131 stop:352 length:222 start_codon:yes stop_codon:yes gene_type:complete